MLRRGPFPETEKQNIMILSKLPSERGIGFNELWRNLKKDNISLSFTTLTKTLNRLIKDNYIQVKEVKKDRIKIPKRQYTKTHLGSIYEQHLHGKLGILDFPTKRILKLREGEFKYNQLIFSNFPFTYELELSAENIDKDKEEIISKFIGDIGETIIHNLAEILNNTYSRFLTSFSEGSVKDAFTELKEGLDFRLKMILAFDGRRIKLDRVAEKLQNDENEMLSAIKAVKIPSQTELLGCWLLNLLSPLIPPEEFHYNLGTVEGWSQLIEDYSNKWRKNKGVPLLEKKDIAKYLNDLIERGELAINPIQVHSGILEFKKMPEPQPEEFYSFLVSIFSGMKSILENTNP